MNYNRKLLEEETLQKIKEVNDEAGYRKYLEVPEMVNIIASIMEEKFNVLFDSQKDQIRSLRAYNDILEKENDSMTDTETKTLKQYEEDWKRIFKTKDQEIEDLKNTIQYLTAELEEYRSIAENVGAAKAVSEKEKLEKIINDTLRALPVGSISRHTPESIPERVQDWVKEAAEECRLREQWEACADNLIVYAKDYAAHLSELGEIDHVDNKQIKLVEDVLEQYNRLKNEY